MRFYEPGVVVTNVIRIVTNGFLDHSICHYILHSLRLFTSLLMDPRLALAVCRFHPGGHRERASWTY